MSEFGDTSLDYVRDLVGDKDVRFVRGNPAAAKPGASSGARRVGSISGPDPPAASITSADAGGSPRTGAASCGPMQYAARLRARLRRGRRLQLRDTK